jgi:hypothetical protein
MFKRNLVREEVLEIYTLYSQHDEVSWNDVSKQTALDLEDWSMVAQLELV